MNFNKINLSNIKIIGSNRPFEYNDKELNIIGYKMEIDNINNNYIDIRFRDNNIDVDFFSNFDIWLIKNLKPKYNDIENIFINSIRRSINNDSLYLRNTKSKYLKYFNEPNETFYLIFTRGSLIPISLDN